MAITLVHSAHTGFADGNGGHAFTLPATPTANNLLVLFVHSDTTVTTPSGWTLPTNGSFVGQMGAYAFYKVAAGNETSVTITTNGNNSTAASYLEYAGTDPTPFELAAQGSTNAANTITTTTVSITPTSAGSLVVAMGAGHNGGTQFDTATWSGGLTNVIVGDFQTSIQHAIGHNLSNAASATSVAATFDPSNRTFTNVGTIALAFKAGVVPDASVSANAVAAAASVPSATLNTNSIVAPSTVGAVSVVPVPAIQNDSLVDALFNLEHNSTTFFSDGGSGHAVTLPATPTSGNLMVLCVNSDTTVSTPSGWTLSTGASFVVQQGAYVFWKVSAGNETSVTIITSGNFATLVTYLEYSGNLSTPFDKAANAQQDHGGYISTPAVSVTPTTTGELLLAFGALAGTPGSTAASSPVWTDVYTNRITTTLNSGFQQFIGDIRGASVAAHSASVSWSTEPINVDFATTGTIVTAFKPAQVVGQNATVLPPAVAGSASVPSTTESLGALVAASVVAAVGLVPAPSVSVPAVNASPSPSAVGAVAAIPSFQSSVSSVLTVDVVTASVSIPTVSLTATGNSTVTPSAVAGTASVPTVTVVVPVHATVMLNAVSAVAVLVAPTVSAVTVFRDVNWTFAKAVQ